MSVVRRCVVFLLLFMLSALAAGCGSESSGDGAPADADTGTEDADAAAAEPEPSDESETETDDAEQQEAADGVCEEMDQVSTGGLYGFTAYPVVVAHEEGFFEEECIEHEFVEGGTGEQYRTAMLAGELDMMVGSVDGNSVLHEALPLVTAVGVMRRAGIMLIISDRHEGTVTRDDPTSLSGLTLSVTGLEAPTHMTLMNFLRDNGMDPETDVDIIPTGGFADGVNQMLDGRIDGMVINDPLGSVTVANGDAFLYTDFGNDPELYPRALSDPYINLATSRDYYEANPDVVRRAVRAVVSAEIAMHQDPDWAVEVAMELFDLEEDVARDVVIEKGLPKYEPYVDQEEWDNFTEFQVEEGFISEPQYFEDQFEEELMAEWERFYEEVPDFEPLEAP